MFGVTLSVFKSIFLDKRVQKPLDYYLKHSNDTFYEVVP